MRRIGRILKFRGLIRILSLIVAAGIVSQPILSQAQKAPGQAAGERKTLGPITVQVPKGWVEKPTTSSMRKMQFNLPRAQGDPEDGEMVVFYFGPQQGGSVEENINRWAGQFAQPDGSPSRQRAKIDKRQVSGIPITTMDVKGTYQAAVTPMSREHHNKPGFRLLAAIVETPEGSYYCKLTGPEKTVARWADSFQKFINSIQKR